MSKNSSHGQQWAHPGSQSQAEAAEDISPIIEWLRALAILTLIAGVVVAAFALLQGSNVAVMVTGVAVAGSALPIFAMARGLLLLERIAKSSGETAVYMGKLVGRATANPAPRQPAQPSPAAKTAEKREPRFEDR